MARVTSSTPLPPLANLGGSQCWPQVTKELSFLAKRGRGALLVTQGMSISSHRALLVTWEWKNWIKNLNFWIIEFWLLNYWKYIHVHPHWTQFPKFMFRSFKTVETRASRLNFQTLPWIWSWPWGQYQKIPIMHFLRVCVLKFMLKASKLWMPGLQEPIFQHLEPEAGNRNYQ